MRSAAGDPVHPVGQLAHPGAQVGESRTRALDPAHGAGVEPPRERRVRRRLDVRERLGEPHRIEPFLAQRLPDPVGVHRALRVDARRGDGQLVEVGRAEPVRRHLPPPALGQRRIEGDGRDVTPGVPGGDGLPGVRIHLQRDGVPGRRRPGRGRGEPVHDHERPARLAPPDRHRIADEQRRPVGRADDAVRHGPPTPFGPDEFAGVRALVRPARVHGMERGHVSDQVQPVGRRRPARADRQDGRRLPDGPARKGDAGVAVGQCHADHSRSLPVPIAARPSRPGASVTGADARDVPPDPGRRPNS
jgi:hypothetical protein